MTELNNPINLFTNKNGLAIDADEYINNGRIKPFGSYTVPSLLDDIQLPKQPTKDNFLKQYSNDKEEKTSDNKSSSALKTVISVAILGTLGYFGIKNAKNFFTEKTAETAKKAGSSIKDKAKGFWNRLFGKNTKSLPEPAEQTAITKTVDEIKKQGKTIKEVGSSFYHWLKSKCVKVKDSSKETAKKTIDVVKKGSVVAGSKIKSGTKSAYNWTKNMCIKTKDFIKSLFKRSEKTNN